jgi:GNAT superfamily N-acetyltransferase
MSVRPDRQRGGVGTRLVRDALRRAEAAGEPAVMVEGIPGYTPDVAGRIVYPAAFAALSRPVLTARPLSRIARR